MTMSIPTRALGGTDLRISELGFGAAPLGDLFERVDEGTAQATLAAAWDGGVRYFDTSPFYGYGKSEHRLGRFLREQRRADFVVSTKVGRVFRPARDPATFDPGAWVGGLPFEFSFDYGYDGIMRSWEDSLQRLGLPSVDLLLIHDIDGLFHHTDSRLTAHEQQLRASGWRALEELKGDGRIGAIGAGINMRPAIARLLDLVDLDFFIVAMPYTLLDQGALDEHLPRCEAAGVGVVIGAPYASGILVTGAVQGARYAYGPASPEILEKTRRIEAVCARHDVPLPAAALQFALAHPTVASIIPGAQSPAHVTSTLSFYGHPIPADLWAELKAEDLVRADAPTP